MRDDYELDHIYDDIAPALRDLDSAIREHDEVRESYDGPSWGYVGSYVIRQVDEARERLKSRFKDIIRAEVRDAVEKALEARDAT